VDLDAEVEINTTCKMIKGNIKIAAKREYKLGKHKSWFDEGC
jgi:hypothetical protein